MSTTTRPGTPSRPRRRERRRGLQWWHGVLAITILLALGGMAWGGYALWFALTHVRAVNSHVAGLVVHISAKTDTRVSQVLVRTGDEVRQGQPVAVLDKADLEAQVEQARANLEGQERALARAERDLELAIREASATIEEAEAQLAAAHARLAQAEAELMLRAEQQPDEVRSAQAALASAESELRDAEATLRRMERLHGEGAISEHALDQARTRAQVAQAAVESAQAALKLALARDHESRIREQTVATRAAEQRQARASLESARTRENAIALKEQEVLARRADVARARAALEETLTRLDDTVLRSPVDGVVVRGPGHSVKDGEVVVKGMPIVTVVATDVPLWISASISELHIGRIREGQPARIRIQAFPRKWFHGTVEKIGKATEIAAEGPQTTPWVLQHIPVRIAFDTEGLDVKHGMTCRVWVDTRNRER